MAPDPVAGNYRYFLSITTRWMDNDVYGHINNVTYGRIDLAGAGLVDLSHRGYHAPGHRDVAHERLAAEPVDEGSVADDEFICHIPNVR